MAQITLNSKEVFEAHQKASKETQKALETIFGITLEFNGDIRDQVKTFEDACQILGISTMTPNVSNIPEKHQKAIISNYKLFIIAEALNEDWTADWNNSNECKYYPWFKMNNGSGLVCAAGGWAGTYSLSDIGSRLCFSSSKLAEYAGKQFIDLYNDVLILK